MVQGSLDTAGPGRRQLRERVDGLVNGILLGHPFTRTRRKLEDLIWSLYGCCSLRQCCLLNHCLLIYIYIFDDVQKLYINTLTTRLSCVDISLEADIEIHLCKLYLCGHFIIYLYLYINIYIFLDKRVGDIGGEFIYI